MDREGRNSDKKKKKKRKKKEKKKGERILGVGEACVAIFLPTPGIKDRTLVSSGLLTEGP